MKLLLLLGISFTCTTSFALDQELQEYIALFNLKPLKQYQNKNSFLIKAGKLLFEDKILSGNRNISCRDCHHPSKGSSDAIALSLGQGSLNTDKDRKQFLGAILKRNSPNLFNLGHANITAMFWDGRVEFKNEIFQTPEPALNGPFPEAFHITQHLNHAMDAQVLFPMLSSDEMMGNKGENEIANAANRLEAWSLIFKRIKKEKREIFSLLELAFPFSLDDDFNIGHIAKALSEFIKVNFQVTNTPYDKYLKGNKDALSEKSKRGLLLFMTKAKCINCHKGENLNDNRFLNVAVPPIRRFDNGRSDVTKLKSDQFKFKTPGLRQLVETAPYMHNGAFFSIKEVVNHYNNAGMSLITYQTNILMGIPYTEKIKPVGSIDYLNQILKFSPLVIRRPLGLTKAEVNDLTHFLSYGLMDIDLFY